jgi:hypothetical protein
VSAGIQISQAEVNNVAGSIARSLFNVLANVDEFKSFLDGFTAQALVDAGYSATLADANNLKSAFTDLGDMSSIWKNGSATQTIAGHDFRVFPRKLIGVGLF